MGRIQIIFLVISKNNFSFIKKPPPFNYFPLNLLIVEQKQRKRTEAFPVIPIYPAQCSVPNWRKQHLREKNQNNRAHTQGPFTDYITSLQNRILWFTSTTEAVDIHYPLTCLHSSRYDLSLPHLILLPFQTMNLLTYLGWPQSDDALCSSASLLPLFMLLQVLILRWGHKTLCARQELCFLSQYHKTQHFFVCTINWISLQSHQYPDSSSPSRAQQLIYNPMPQM